MSDARKPNPGRVARVLVPLSALLLLALAPATPVAAQSGTLVGRITDAESGAPLSDVMVTVEGAEASPDAVLTDVGGRYRITGLPPGRYAVVARHVGYETLRRAGVRIRADETTTVDVTLTSRSFRLNPVVVTASRREEKSLEAPAHVSIVGSEEIEESPAITATEHVEGLPGVDVARNGIQQANIVTRGFNNVFSGALLVMTDNRYARVPSLRFNAYNLIPTTNLDLDRIEVVLGPGAALYGPNSANGVMHMVTKSPFESRGTTVSVAGGERSVFHGAFRHAQTVSEKVAFKVSGQYFRGDDFVFHDPAEVAARRDTIEDFLAAGGDPADTTEILVGRRDFDASRITGDVRVDIRMDDGSEVILSGGMNQLVSGIEMTGLGAGQADDWRYSYGQVRYIRDRLFAQAFLNVSDAGDTYLLRSGSPIVDESLLYAVQLQHGFDLGTDQTFTYGLDYQHTTPRTKGTITGRNEDSDEIDEIGGYLHSETTLSDRFTFVAAVRLDEHSELDDPNVSPRAALVFRPRQNQNFRVTFNRAFSTPTTNNLFLDLLSQRLPLESPFDFGVRARGVPETGFTFRRGPDGCAGGIMDDLCMRTPLAPGSAVPANVGAIWDQAIGAVAPELAGILPPPPSGGDLTLLRRLNPSAEEGQTPFPADLEGPRDVDRIDSPTRNTFEVGYKGLVSDRLLVQADAYYTDIKDFIGPLKVETPSVFFSPLPLRGYLDELESQGLLTPEQNDELFDALSQLPLGTVAPEQSGSDDILLTYRNFGNVDLWGVDLALRVLATDRLSLDGNVSVVSDECFDFNGDALCEDAVDVALNAPDLKWRIRGRYHDEVAGITAEAQLRHTDGFPVNSGVYVGEIEGYEVVDANVAYRIPGLRGTTVSVAARNLLDDDHRQFVGAPRLGRVVLARLRYDF